jgi:hypothetical protein
VILDYSLGFVLAVCGWVLLISVFDSDDDMRREWSLRAQNGSPTQIRVSRFVGAVLFMLVSLRLFL